MKFSKGLAVLVCVIVLSMATFSSRQQASVATERPTSAAKNTATDASVASMVNAVQQWLESLPEELRTKANLSYDDPMRLVWHYYPRTAWQRSGVTLKELDDSQKRLFMNVVRAGTSARGYETSVNLMELEAILRDIENTPFARKFRDPERFYLTIFGTPSLTERWSWKLEGHHLLLNYVIEKGRIVSGTPFVFGANPGRVPSGPQRGLRILPKQEDLGRLLYTSLSTERRDDALIAVEPPFDVITNADTFAKRVPQQGVAFSALDKMQQSLIEQILEVYVGLLPDDVSKPLKRAILENERDEVRFGWAGSAEPGRSHYYQVSGPSFVVEYCNTQNSGNHIHVVWRDYENDFGGREE